MPNYRNEETDKKEYLEDEINLLDYWRVVKKKEQADLGSILSCGIGNRYCQPPHDSYLSS